MTAAEVMDVKAKLPGCAGQAADSISAYSKVKMEDAPSLLKKIRSHNVQIFGYVIQKKLETPMAPAVPCKTCKKSKNEETRSKTNDFKSKCVCILEASESTCVWWKNLYQNIMRIILQKRGTIHYNITIWYSCASSHEGTRSTSGSG